MSEGDSTTASIKDVAALPSLSSQDLEHRMRSYVGRKTVYS